MDNNLQELQDIHVAAWNEKDASKRYELLKQIYTDDVKMYDKDVVFASLTEVSDFIGKLLTEDAAFHFSAVKPIEGLQNSARLYGRIITSQVTLNSMDFFILENGKVKHLYAFMEPVV